MHPISADYEFVSLLVKTLCIVTIISGLLYIISVDDTNTDDPLAKLVLIVAIVSYIIAYMLEATICIYQGCPTVHAVLSATIPRVEHTARAQIINL